MSESSASWPLVFAELAHTDVELNSGLVSWAMTEILEERATDAQTAAFVLGLKIRGESPEIVSVLAEVMMNHANIVPTTHGHRVVLDIVGTGGDGSHSVNISTMAAIVAATCGAIVIKHGNRAVSSSTGAADLLEEMGVAIDLDAQGVAEVAREVGIAFCFAPRHHPAMRFAAPARKQLGIPTVFNLLGPLTNPAKAKAGLIGCANIDMAPIMARVLLDRGVKALVVRGDDGLDEISLAQPTRVWDVTSDSLRELSLTPEDFGVSDFDPELLRGGDKYRNAMLAQQVLGGKPCLDADAQRVAAIRLSVAVNAAAALVAADAVLRPEIAKTVSLPERINSFLPQATQVLEDSTAWNVVLQWIDVSRKVAQLGNTSA